MSWGAIVLSLIAIVASIGTVVTSQHTINRLNRQAREYERIIRQLTRQGNGQK
jgi:hypothetical protein